MNAQSEMDECPRYRFYEDTEEYRHVAGFHIWIGEFSEKETEQMYYDDDGDIHGMPWLWERPGVIFISEDAFEFFLPVIRPIMPDFHWWGGNNFNTKERELLLRDLRGYLDRLLATRTMQDLIDLSERHVWERGWTFETLKPRLVTMTGQFIAIVQKAVDTRRNLWMTGP